MHVDHYIEDTPDIHWPDILQPLNLYTYKNVYDDHIYKQLKNTIVSHLNNHNQVTSAGYKTHNTTFIHNDKKLHLLSNVSKTVQRYQQVFFDLSMERNYWNQTKDTIHDWAWNELHKTTHPLMYHHLSHFKSIEPHDEDSWIPVRCHINYLEYTKYLYMHIDMQDSIFNTPMASFAKARTLTFYLYNHIEGEGGEFYTHNGFVYKPKENEAISINGNAVLHGVNSNMNNDVPRLAFSVRWVHKDDLYLPGHPDKSMYTQEFFD